MADEVILAIDPGSHKCGWAVVSRPGQVLHRGVAAVDELAGRIAELVHRHRPGAVLLGNGTAMKKVSSLLRNTLEGTPVVVVDEKHTTERARVRYLRDHPPRGLMRLIPLGLRVPPVPYDDYAAVVLAEDYLKKSSALT